MDNDRNAPATTGDVQNLESRFEGKLDASQEHILGRVEVMIRDTETRLLRAFYSFAAHGGREAAALKDRLATVESRLMEVEKRLNMPPAA